MRETPVLFRTCISPDTFWTYTGGVPTDAPGQNLLTDNGSEYQGEFDEYLKREGIVHCYTYPRCPKMNALSERFNCTVQEEFVEYHEDALLGGL